jgi:hypothetical protein
MMQRRGMAVTQGKPGRAEKFAKKDAEGFYPQMASRAG